MKYFVLTFLVILFSQNSKGQNSTLNIDFEKIKSLSNAQNERLVAVFKDLHENPELGFMEVRTAAIVANFLNPDINN